jgi:uncharacterized protein DUF6665
MSRDFRLHRVPLDVLNYEIAQDTAVALGRMGRALEQALAKLQEFDAHHPRSGSAASAQKERRTLVTEAGHALWMFVVQREACGLRDSRTVMRDYNVPGEVQRCMGLSSPQPHVKSDRPYDPIEARSLPCQAAAGLAQQCPDSSSFTKHSMHASLSKQR